MVGRSSFLGVRARLTVADPRVLRRGSAFSSHLLRTPSRRCSQNSPTETVRNPRRLPLRSPAATTEEPVDPFHLLFCIPAKSTVGALLVSLFGQYLPEGKSH